MTTTIYIHKKDFNDSMAFYQILECFGIIQDILNIPKKFIDIKYIEFDLNYDKINDYYCE